MQLGVLQINCVLPSFRCLLNINSSLKGIPEYRQKGQRGSLKCGPFCELTLGDTTRKPEVCPVSTSVDTVVENRKGY